MIDFENVWLPQIVSYAALVRDQQLEDQWLGRSATLTSVTSPNELYVQVFDDLDADRIWADARQNAELSPQARDAIDRFLTALRSIDEADAVKLMSSDAWVRIGEAANGVLANVQAKAL